MNEDFFAFTYISLLSHVHLLVVLFQAERRQEINAKRLECEAAEINYKRALEELDEVEGKDGQSEYVLALAAVKAETAKKIIEEKERTLNEAEKSPTKAQYD